MRCPCGELFRVEQARALRARALICHNCGGPVGSADEDCPYCGAGIAKAERSSLLCPKCFERMDPAAKHCPACGVGIHPQALTALPERTACPRCEQPLSVRSLGETSVVECTACQGLWVSRGDFEVLCRRARAEAEALPDPRAAEEPIRAAEPERKVVYIPCPTCGQRMNRRMFRYRELPSRVVLDLCREHGVWFDREELRRVLAFVRSHANQDLPRPPAGSLEPRRRAPAGGAPFTMGADGLFQTLILDEVIGDLLGGVLGALFD